MAREFFYNATTKKIIVAFATIFDEITILNDHGELITVPLHFAQKEKFIDDINTGHEYDPDGLTKDITLPRMGFELSGVNFAPERHTHHFNNILERRDGANADSMFNRVAYDLTFDLFIGTRRLEDGLKIVEQIIPFFAPSLTLTVRDKDGFQLETNIVFTLNSVAHQIDYEGSMDQRRTIIWTLNFTAKAYYYADVKKNPLIQQMVLDFHDKDTLERLERITIDAEDIDPLEPPILDVCDFDIWGGDAYSTGDDL